ncbi:MAG: LacI family transcriptional regulator [Firmicutes bacterium]|nr:LacI family transcriptional regulator [Bacillota bacterium]
MEQTARLSGKPSYLVGIFMHYNPMWGLHHAFPHEILLGLGKRLAELGGDFVLFPEAWLRNPLNYLEHCARRGVDGAILMGVDLASAEIRNLAESKLPCLFLDEDSSSYPEDHGYFLAWDHRQGIHQAVDYLYALGHRAIGLIEGLPNTYACRRRTEAFRTRLADYGLPFRKEWVAGDDFTRESGYYAMQTILRSKERPTAVVCQSDAIAVGALSALRQAGLACPNEMSIVGYDDIEVSRHVTPALTTVRQDTVLLGRLAADTIVHGIAGGGASREQILPVSLIVRDSCSRVEYT